MITITQNGETKMYVAAIYCCMDLSIQAVPTGNNNAHVEVARYTNMNRMINAMAEYHRARKRGDEEFRFPKDAV